MPPMPRLARIAAILVLFSAAVSGCSSEPSRYAATGTVIMDGAPAPLVIVTFHPAESNSHPGGRGRADQAGKFTIGEDGKNTGLPKGEYKVTFSQTLVGGKPDVSGSGGKAAEKRPGEKEAVADDYRDPQKTPITATIGGGPNSFTFDIKAKK